MKIGQKLWTKERGWADLKAQAFPSSPQLVFVFGSRMLMEDKRYFNEIRGFYPGAHILECSTAGEILGTSVRDDSISLTAVFFEKTEVHVAETNIKAPDESADVGKKLVEMLPAKDLIHAMVFTDGLRVNGTTLARALNKYLPPHVSVTGGMVGDGELFQKTVVGLDHVAEEGKVVLIGFSGTALKVGYGSFGGWDTFGIERVITKSAGNVLYELDGKPALELYKTYLGEKASGLPATGLLFPLRLRMGQDQKTDVVRTVLSVSEPDQSMTFAGDMPVGASASLMKANFERLIDGAYRAGSMSQALLGDESAELAVLIGCVGRRLVLKERIEEEIEAVRSALGPDPVLCGFYSYGELCPTSPTEKQCLLHNQTMTITTLKEM